MSAVPLIAIECATAPGLDWLPTAWRERFSFDAHTHELRVTGPLDHAAIRDLRAASADPAWQLLVDRLVVAAASAGAMAADSAARFPSTMWGLLLVELGTKADDAWRRFMDMYRAPVAGMIRKILRRIDADNHDPRDLADEFFGWFFANKVYEKLRRVDEAGRVAKFRGYLRRCIVTFLRETATGRDAQTLADARPLNDAGDAGGGGGIGGASEAEIAAIVDRELCRDAVESELETIRRDHFSLWQALMFDFRGLTLAEVAEHLRAESAGKKGSVTQAHEARQRARDVFRDRLIRYRLRSGVVTEADAAADFHELVPVLADVMLDYVARQAAPADF